MGWVLAITIFLFTVTFHEYAHGFVASCLGDDTAKRRGRLTLNPLKHIDPFWTVLLPVAMYVSTGGRLAIGQAKPVPVDFRKLRPVRLGTILVALAGPGANLILAFLSAVLFHSSGSTLVLFLGVYLNLGLAMFNLLPIPPLDGSRILLAVFPLAWHKWYALCERYGFLIICVLYYFGMLRTLVNTGMNFFCRVLQVPLVFA